MVSPSHVTAKTKAGRKSGCRIDPKRGRETRLLAASGSRVSRLAVQRESLGPSPGFLLPPEPGPRLNPSNPPLLLCCTASQATSSASKYNVFSIPIQRTFPEHSFGYFDLIQLKKSSICPSLLLLEGFPRSKVNGSSDKRKAGSLTLGVPYSAVAPIVEGLL